MDDVLNVPEAVLVPAGKRESAFMGPLTEALGAFVTRLGLLGSADAKGFTCEVPFTGSRPAVAMIQDGKAPETALVRVLSDVPHPAFGSGALLTISLPLSFDEKSRSRRSRIG